MAKEFKDFQMEIFIKETILMENLVGLESITGRMEAILKELFQMGWEMVVDSGKEVQESVINMKVNIQMIKSLDMAYLLGVLVTFIKETMKMMLETGMEKCFGMMAAIIKENGQMELNMDKESFMSQVKELKEECLKTII